MRRPRGGRTPGWRLGRRLPPVFPAGVCIGATPAEGSSAASVTVSSERHLEIPIPGTYPRDTLSWVKCDICAASWVTVAEAWKPVRDVQRRLWHLLALARHPSGRCGLLTNGVGRLLCCWSESAMSRASRSVDAMWRASPRAAGRPDGVEGLCRHLGNALSHGHLPAVPTGRGCPLLMVILV